MAVDPSGLSSAELGASTVTGSVDVAGEVFAGLFGVGVSTGGVVDVLNPNLGSITPGCLQVGIGLFAGGGVTVEAGLSDEALSSGSVDSVGVFGNVGALGAAAGVSVNVGERSVGGAKGFAGVGVGISVGVQFCRTSLACVGD